MVVVVDSHGIPEKVSPGAWPFRRSLLSGADQSSHQDRESTARSRDILSGENSSAQLSLSKQFRNSGELELLEITLEITTEDVRGLGWKTGFGTEKRHNLSGKLRIIRRKQISWAASSVSQLPSELATSQLAAQVFQLRGRSTQPRVIWRLMRCTDGEALTPWNIMELSREKHGFRSPGISLPVHRRIS